MEAASFYYRLCCYDDQRRSVYFYSEAYFGLAAARMDLRYAAGCCDCRPAQWSDNFFLYAPVRKLFYFQEDEK